MYLCPARDQISPYSICACPARDQISPLSICVCHGRDQISPLSICMCPAHDQISPLSICLCPAGDQISPLSIIFEWHDAVPAQDQISPECNPADACAADADADYHPKHISRQVGNQPLNLICATIFRKLRKVFCCKLSKHSVLLSQCILHRSG